jgi:hypothetical protein
MRHRRAPGRRGRFAAAAVLAALAAGSVLTGVHLLQWKPAVHAADVGTVPIAAQVTARPTPPRPTPSRRAPDPAPRRPRVSTSTGPAPAPPSAFRLPSAEVSAPVTPIGVRLDGELRIPESARVVGWWVGSAPAGSPRGSTVLTGHVDSARDGVGAFAALRDVAVGAEVELTDTFRGRHPYRVVARRTYPKYALPADVFRVRGPARLVLITCGGPFDSAAGRYRDNVVVYAVPTG